MNTLAVIISTTLAIGGITPDVFATQGVLWVDAIAKVSLEFFYQFGTVAAAGWLAYDKLVSQKLMKQQVQNNTDLITAAVSAAPPVLPPLPLTPAPNVDKPTP